MDNHAERLNAPAANELAEEISVARELRRSGYMSGFALYDWERRALARLVADGRVNHDLTSARRYTLTTEGRAWLEKQEG